jgi:hypothetical protein
MSMFGRILPRLWLYGLTLLGCMVAVPAVASECFDHYNPEAWHGQGLAIVLCRNSPDFDRCELRRAEGARLAALVRHGSPDRGRIAWTVYRTLGSTYPFALDVVCTTDDGFTDTIRLPNGGRWADGCCRHRNTGPCCGSGEAPQPPPPEDIVEGASPDGPACPLLPSREFDEPIRTLDVQHGEERQLLFHVDGVPEPAELTGAVLQMRLGDADHPGEEGQVYVNGNGPFDLPARNEWNDQEAAAILAVRADFLRPGSNVVAFGGGTRDRTYYGVGQVALQVHGQQCASSPPDAAPPPPLDATLSGPDAGPPIPDAASDPSPVPDSSDSVSPASDGAQQAANPDAWQANSATETEQLDGGGCTHSQGAPANPLALLLIPLLAWVTRSALQ